jgi:KRAB domain-containing zinc finger protein
MKFKWPHQLRDHNQHQGIKPYSCSWPDCDQWFWKSDSLRQHFKAHYEENMYACDFCNRRFSRRCHLKSHIKTHCKNDKENKKLVCTWQDCGKQFELLRQLKCHMRTHTAEATYVCAVCSMGFRHSSNLQRHIKIHNNRDNENDNENSPSIIG